MAVYHTTNSLIESIKTRAMVPENQNTFTVARFLNFINEEMDMGIVPLMLSFHEDYLLSYLDIPLEAGVGKYPIPERAIGNKLHDVYFVDSNQSGSVYEMTRVSTGDLTYFQYATMNGSSIPLKAFYTEGDSVCLLPLNNTVSVGSLRMYHHRRPNRLVEETRAGKITAINTSTGEITLSNLPSVFSGDSLFDIVKARSPYKTTAMDLSVSNITGNVLTFNPTDLPKDLKVGDYINLAEETIIPQIPPELHSMLAQRVAARCLEALNDQQGLAAANAKIAEMEAKTGSLIDNRVDNAPQKVVNRHGFLRLSRRSNRR